MRLTLITLALLSLAACAAAPHARVVPTTAPSDELVIAPPEPGTPPADDPTQQHEPRDLGSHAALHLYWYAPSTLEITHVETYLYEDVGKCEDNIGKALMIASPFASEGDLVAGKCIALHPPEAPKAPPPKGESTL
jgi:hypothetical protein